MTTTSHPTKNLFSNLSVEREAEEEVELERIKAEEQYIISQPLSSQKIKKKVRPEEIQKLREEQQVTELQTREVTSEGVGEFKEVKKGRRNEQELVNEMWIPDESGRKGITKPHRAHWTRPRGGKRMFDRHSGTGRGREIPKQGAGGKTTWGNIDQYAKEEMINYMAGEGEEYYNPGDEDCKYLKY
jgi:hypothetical protein